MKHLVIDSGATKADWKLIDGAECAATIHTSGINPLFQGGAELLEILSNEVLPKIGNDVSKISFYAAGIVGDEQKQSVASVFAKVFPDAAVEAESDLVAAARAICGNQPGIACIVGTGSNTCCWDGSRIVKNVRAGGFILGDEFSGAYLGKRLLGDYIKGLVPRALENELQKRYGLSYETIVRNVYKSVAPGRYLASFAPFIKEFENHPYCKSL
ncbi:MAG: hypothetical protein HUJ91_07985, partial [Bacteroidales bacterium]|nr:hypothetical protein [Bacteroidales bacterium]